MGLDEIFHRYVPEHEIQMILAKAHGHTASGHYAGKVIAQKVFRAYFGGLHYRKMQRSNVEPVMCVKE